MGAHSAIKVTLILAPTEWFVLSKRAAPIGKFTHQIRFKCSARVRRVDSSNALLWPNNISFRLAKLELLIPLLRMVFNDCDNGWYRLHRCIISDIRHFVCCAPNAFVESGRTLFAITIAVTLQLFVRHCCEEIYIEPFVVVDIVYIGNWLSIQRHHPMCVNFRFWRGHDISPILDVNCVDSLRFGALTIAIDADNLEIIKLLVIMSVDDMFQLGFLAWGVVPTRRQTICKLINRTLIVSFSEPRQWTSFIIVVLVEFYQVLYIFGNHIYYIYPHLGPLEISLGRMDACMKWRCFGE